MSVKTHCLPPPARCCYGHVVSWAPRSRSPVIGPAREGLTHRSRRTMVNNAITVP